MNYELFIKENEAQIESAIIEAYSRTRLVQGVPVLDDPQNRILIQRLFDAYIVSVGGAQNLEPDPTFVMRILRKTISDFISACSQHLRPGTEARNICNELTSSMSEKSEAVVSGLQASLCAAAYYALTAQSAYACGTLLVLRTSDREDLGAILSAHSEYLGLIEKIQTTDWRKAEGLSLDELSSPLHNPILAAIYSARHITTCCERVADVFDEESHQRLYGKVSSVIDNPIALHLIREVAEGVRHDGAIAKDILQRIQDKCLSHIRGGIEEFIVTAIETSRGIFLVDISYSESNLGTILERCLYILSCVEQMQMRDVFNELNKDIEALNVDHYTQRFSELKTKWDQIIEDAGLGNRFPALARIVVFEIRKLISDMERDRVPEAIVWDI